MCTVWSVALGSLSGPRDLSARLRWCFSWPIFERKCEIRAVIWKRVKNGTFLGFAAEALFRHLQRRSTAHLRTHRASITSNAMQYFAFNSKLCQHSRVILLPSYRRSFHSLVVNINLTVLQFIMIFRSRCSYIYIANHVYAVEVTPETRLPPELGGVEIIHHVLDQCSMNEKLQWSVEPMRIYRREHITLIFINKSFYKNLGFCTFNSNVKHIHCAVPQDPITNN